MPVPYYFNHSSFEICFEIRTCDASNFALLLKKTIGCSRSFVVPYEFKDI